MTRAQILRVYALYIGASICVFLFGILFDRSSFEALQNVLIAVLFMLAGEGLERYFPAENEATRSLMTQFEYYVLQGLLFAAVMVLIVLSDTIQTVSALVFNIFGITLAWALMQFAVFYLRDRKPIKHD